MSDWKVVVPEATTNNVLNPSAETTANFAAAGGSTVTRVTTVSWSESYSYRVQTAANNEGVEFTLDTLANAIHYVTVRVAGTLPAVWDWSLDNGTYTAPVLLEAYDGTWSLYGLQFPAAQANGSTTLYIDQNGVGAGDFNLDAIQVEEKTYWTTYCDGDQGGCEWNGAEDASTSTRSALSRAGGRVQDFDTDYSFKVSQYIGSGMAPVEQIVDEYAILPGGQVLGHKTQIRSFSLPGLLSGTSSSDLHSKRQALVGIFEPQGIPDDQPFILRYEGATIHKQVFAYYEAGLSFGIRASFCWNERLALRFLAADPFWYEIGETSTALDTNDTATIRYVTGRLRSTGQWDDLGLTANPTTVGNIWAILQASDGSVYAGGDFTGMDGVAGRDYIARYIPSTDTWETIGGGGSVNGVVRAIAEAPNGDIYIGGNFTNVGGATGDYLAYWDISGSVWSPVSGGGTAQVFALAFGPDGTLYIGGSFVNWNAIAAADYIVIWNGAAYAAIAGTTLNALVHDIKVRNTDNQVFVGGNFTDAGGDADADYVAQHNGTDFSALTPTPLDSVVWSLAFDNSGNLYIGGEFTNAGGDANGDYVCKWNGTAFEPLGQGLNNWCYKVVARGGSVWAGGVFTQAGDVTVDRIAKFNGSVWGNIDIDFPATSLVYAIALGPSDPVIAQNFNVWVGPQDTGGAAFAGAATITHAGTTNAFPRIIIGRDGGTSATLISIRNETTGKELLFSYALLDGETLTIDLAPTQQSIVSSFFGPRPDAILKGSDFGSFSLIPSSKGTNNITAFVDVAGGPTITAFAVWSDTFWGLD